MFSCNLNITVYYYHTGKAPSLLPSLPPSLPLSQADKYYYYHTGKVTLHFKCIHTQWLSAQRQ